MWDYTDKVQEHFINPKNVGEIEQPSGMGEVGSLSCGDALKLTFKLGDDQRIADALLAEANTRFERFAAPVLQEVRLP